MAFNLTWDSSELVGRGIPLVHLRAKVIFYSYKVSFTANNLTMLMNLKMVSVLLAFIFVIVSILNIQG